MKRLFGHVCCYFFCLLVLASLGTAVSAQEAFAKDLSQDVLITRKGISYVGNLTDGKTGTVASSYGNCTLTLESPEPIGSLYLLFDDFYGPYTVIDNATGNTFTAGANRYLHEYIDVAAALGEEVFSVTLDFSNGGVILTELYVFAHGQVPDFVQRWQPPLEGSTDILLFAAHSDDDQLFFAGLFPLYARELGYQVQVAYMTDHRRDDWIRSHEVLNGLWATGITNYPVFGKFSDFRRDTLEATYQTYEQKGVSRDDLLGFVVEQIRRFDPIVVIGHDFNGEYGHGMHMVYADLVAQAVEITADETQFPDSAQAYGTWDVSKTYIHAYEENPIAVDYDSPLESFGGLTAFQVAQQLGFPCHKSQIGISDFRYWLYGRNQEITKASEIAKYPPHKFGLLRTTVGPDVEKNDFMENVLSHREQARLEEERIEQERLEAERLEQERLEAEQLEAQRQEQARLEAEQQQAQAQLEAERKALAEAKARKQRLILLLAAMAVCAISLVLVLFSLHKKKRGKFSKKR